MMKTQTAILRGLLVAVLCAGSAAATVVKVTAAERREAARKLPELAGSLPAGPVKAYLETFGDVGPSARIAVVNAVRVTRDLEETATQPAVVHYVVPAMSVLQRLPDVYPVDGRANGELRILAAKDEYEPASFLLFPFADREKVELRLSPLTTKNGRIFPEENLDLTVIKVWYQNGNGWYSYFADVGLKLIPELLLHDENVIRVDTENVRNYARVDYPEGAGYHWISAPRHLEDEGFRFSSLPFADAKTLQPVSLTAGEFKQFFLTAHVEKDCLEGVYRGRIDLVASGGVIGSVPVALRVLPITLPKPKTYFDRDQDFAVALMGGTKPWLFRKKLGGDEERARALRLAVLKNQRAHNIYHSEVNDDPKSIEDIRNAGMATDLVFGPTKLPWFGRHWGGRLSYDDLMKGKIHSRKASEYYRKHLGHNNILMSYADEPGANYMAMIRTVFHEYLNYDFLVGTPGHDQVINKGGYVFRNTPFGSFPEHNARATKANRIGRSYVGFYAGQHNGVENPQFVRRQHGMLSYLTNCSMVNNYEFGLSTWNDLARPLYKPMNLAYGTSDGVVDTLAWEGFREGIDDIRYATRLMQLADEAAGSRNLKLKIAGLKVRQYVALLEPTTMDLNELRMAMVQKILEIKALGVRR